MEPTEEPYLVFTKNRPHRIVFIIDVSKRQSFSDVVHLIKDLSKKWGGKFFQVIPMSNGVVTDKWIECISTYDPDLIYAFTKPSDRTINRITRKCNPYAFMPANRIEVPNHPDDPIDVLPDYVNTAKLWRNSISSPEILNFDIGDLTNHPPRYIANFIEVNFGGLSDGLVNSTIFKSSTAAVKKLQAKTRTQFLDSMRVLDEWNRRLYPSEYCMLPGVTNEVNRDIANETTTLFIGDKPLDLIYYWNEALTLPSWLSTMKTQAWIPSKFVEDEALRKSVRGWLSKFVRQGNGSPSIKELKIVSSSINLNTLKRHSKLLTDGLFFRVTVEKRNAPKKLQYGEHIATSTDMESFSVSGNSFSINILEVDVQQGVMGGQRWMTDILIERKDHNEYRRPLKQFWLQFPQDNNLALLVTGRGRSGRINRDGMLSVPLSRDKDFLRLSLEIPDNASIAQNILIGERNSVHFNGDVRKGVETRPFSDVTNSSAGRSLRGAIHLFGGLAGAAQFFESKFWRDTFMTLAGSNPLGDIAQATNLTNKIQKNLKKVSQPVTQKATDAWVKTVTDYASDLRAMSEIKPYSFFTERLRQEIIEAKKSGDVDKFEVVERRLLNRLNWLITSGILSPGLMNRCIHCGLKSWYSIEELKTDNNCRGCGYEFAVHAEQKWWYKLNSLISSGGGIYNQIPLILALGELYSRSSSSFYYYPPVDVYGKSRRSPLTDLDIFAIVDGKLVIGEVKNTQKLFSDGDLAKIEDAAIRLRPSVVYLSSLDEKPSASTLASIEALRKRLQRHEVQVDWLEMSPAFGLHGLWGI